MKIVKKMYLRTYIDKDKKEVTKWLPTYYLTIEGCKPIPVKCVYDKDFTLLDFVAEWGGFQNAENDKQVTKENN